MDTQHIRETRKPRLFRINPRAAVFALLAAIGMSNLQAQDQGLLLKAKDQDTWRASLILDTDVQFQIRGLMAEVTIEQRFRNDTGDWQEGRYLLPLPENAAIGKMQIRVGQRVIEGEVQEKQQAQANYVAAAAQGKVAALVAQNRPNLFRTSVANIAPFEEVDVRITYWQPVRFADGEFSVHLPLTLTPRYRSAGSEAEVDAQAQTVATGQPQAVALPPSVSVSAEIDAGIPLARIYSPSFKLQLSSKSGKHIARLKRFAELADRDFELRWVPQASQNAQSAVFVERIDNEHFVSLMLMPPSSNQQVVPRELILVIDNSGSMDGASMQQAIAAADKALARLRNGDLFNVIRFDDSMETVFAQSVPATSENIAHARRFVGALYANGGTEIRPALERAFVEPVQEGFVRQVVLITDAAIGNERELFQVIEQQRGKARLFPVGIGSAPNTHFVHKAAALGQGSPTLIRNISEVEEGIDQLLSKLDHPAMRDISVLWPNLAEVYPKRLPDLYHGEPLQLVARVANLDGKVKVSGVSDQMWNASIDLKQSGTAQGIHRLWAHSRIDDLEDQMRSGMDATAGRTAVLEVALKHQIVSRFTSFIAVEREPSRPESEQLKSTQIANANPSGSVNLAQGSTDMRAQLLLAAALMLIGLVLIRRT